MYSDRSPDSDAQVPKKFLGPLCGASPRSLEPRAGLDGDGRPRRPDILVPVPQTRPDLTGRPVALFVFSNLREQKGGLTKAWLRRLAIFHEAGWDTHVATIHPQPEIDETLAAWRDRGWLPDRTAVHHYQRRTRRLRPSWSRATDETWTRDDRIADWLDWLVGRIPGVVVFADSPVTYAPVAKMRNPYVGTIMTVHLAHRGSKKTGSAGATPAGSADRSIYQGPAGTPKLSGRFLPYAGAANAVVAPTHRQAEHLREDVPGLDVTVIPNILDAVEVPDPPARDPRLLVQLGRLDPFKRIDHAIRAVALARRDVPDLRLEVYGRGPDLDRLVALRDELGLGESVAFRGFTDEPLRVLASATASVMTSRREGFGLAVAESLAVGTPVVSYDIDYGPAELIEDGVTGRLVRSGSVAALAEALTEVVTHPTAWQRMSVAGPAAVEPLRAEAIAARWLDLAEMVAGQVALPSCAFLVEDLRVRRDGLEVSGVAVCAGAEDGRSELGIEGVAEVAASLHGPTGPAVGPLVAREMSATMPWSVVGAWPVGAALQGRRGGDSIPVLGPGLPVTAAPTRTGLVVIGPDSRGVPRRNEVDRAVLDVQPSGAQARVGGDATVVTETLHLRGRLVGTQAAPAHVDLTVETPGLELDPASVVPVTVRAAGTNLLVGTLHVEPGRGRRKGRRWVARTRLEWDEMGLAALRAADAGPVPVSLGAGRSLRPIGRVDFGADRPITLRVAGPWLLAPRDSGRLVLIPGWGLRIRASRLARRRRLARRPG